MISVMYSDIEISPAGGVLHGPVGKIEGRASTYTHLFNNFHGELSGIMMYISVSCIPF